jgi:hypothetical protein
LFDIIGVQVKDAVLYQIIVTFMYVASSVLSTMLCVLFCVYFAFDADCRLRLDRITERKSFKIYQSRECKEKEPLLR